MGHYVSAKRKRRSHLSVLKPNQMALKELLVKLAASLIEHEVRHQLNNRGIDLDAFERQLKELLEAANRPRGQNPFLIGTPVQSPAAAFRTLGLPASSSPEEIKARYRKLICDNHPDKHGNSQASNKKLGDIISAYKTLQECGRA